MPPSSKRGGRGGKAAKSTTSGRPLKIRKLKEVTFDEDARKEYLTGFSKRKKARELVARTKAIDRDREEANENRRTVRDERKERAALNVRNAAELYGDAGANDDDNDDESGSDEEESPRKAIVEAEYETSGLITTVLVESFNLSRSPTPERHPSRSPPPGGYEVDEDGKGMKSTRVSGSVSSKKRVKNKPQFRPKMSRADKKERATGGKSKKAGFLKGNVGTKGKANKGKP